MKIETYSHQDGNKLTNSSAVQLMLSKLNFNIYSGSSKTLRRVVIDELMRLGWSGKAEIDAASRITITAISDGCGLCLQTGNMSRFYADILKLECLYKKEKIKGALFIIPSKEASKKLGSNIAHFERLTQELDVFRDVITIPIFVIGIS